VLREEEIVRVAKLRRLKPWQEERRYLQALILYAVSNWPLVLKGGTYLWLFHGLNRFSVDLDFTATGSVSANEVAEIPEVLRLFGVESWTEILKDDKYTLNIRVAAKGPLYKSEKDTSYIRLDISRREKPLLKPVSVRLDEPLYGIPLVFLSGLDLKEALAEKIRAFYVRKSPRDLYDAWFLVHRGINMDMSLLESKLAFYNLRFNRKQFFMAISEIENTWRTELEPIVLGALPTISEVKATFMHLLGT
jgi:predicted nucleotidyltransferase component of viral defense system